MRRSREIFTTLLGAAVLVAATTAEQAAADSLNDLRIHVEETVAKALKSNGGRIEVLYQGTPNKQLVDAIATSFTSEKVAFKPGVMANAITLAYCGYESEDHSALLVALNHSKFKDRTVVGAPTDLIGLEMPPCLLGDTFKMHRIVSGETAKTLAQKYYQKPDELSEAFCQMLLAANARDVCRDSAAKKLAIGDPIRVLVPAQVTALSNREARAGRTLRLGQYVRPSVLAATLVKAAEAPSYLEVRPQKDAQQVIPVESETCNDAIKPFDADAVIEAFFRPIIKDRRNNKNTFDRLFRGWQPTSANVGIIDTGLYSIVEATSRTEAKRDAFLMANAKGPLSMTISASGEYRGDIEPSPDDKYRGHGTHVFGLVLGGASLWRYLLDTRVDESSTRKANTSSLMFGYLPQVAFVKVTSRGSPLDAPLISADSIEKALSHIRPHVDVVNFSHKAPHSPSLQKEFEEYAAQQKVVVSAAGNDYDGKHEYQFEYSVSEPLLAAMLTNDESRYFITVGAADRTLTAPAPFSNRSSRRLDLFAPGSCVESFAAGSQNEKFISMSGTSQAAPLVTFTISLLRRLMMPPEELKFRILDTVDYHPDFENTSISEGILNVAKALDFFDDIVVLWDKTPQGGYERGRLVAIDNGKEEDDLRVCDPTQRGADLVAVESTLRDARRIVIDRKGNGKIVLVKPGNYTYYKCSINKELKLHLKGANIPDFSLSQVKEIIPRPAWLPSEPLQ
jgi:subtilisin family serine protease